MEFSKNINGERWSLTQDYAGQVIIKKGKKIMSIQNLNYKLDARSAFNLLSKAPSMKYHPIKTDGAVRKLNNEENNKEMETKKLIMPKPHRCLFCGTIPEVYTSKSTDSSRNCRELRCGCLRKTDSQNGVTINHAKWIFTVDVINDKQDEADIRLINEWNQRMPEISK